MRMIIKIRNYPEQKLTLQRMYGIKTINAISHTICENQNEVEVGQIRDRLSCVALKSRGIEIDALQA